MEETVRSMTERKASVRTYSLTVFPGTNYLLGIIAGARSAIHPNDHPNLKSTWTFRKSGKSSNS